MSHFLEVISVSRRFTGASRAALDRVSFSADREELVTLVGASGSGKTTMLRILAGLDHPDQGTVTLAGEVLSRENRIVLPPEHRNMGFVFQNHALFPHLKVRDNVAFGLPRSGSRRQLVGELLELVGMGDLAGRFPHELSGGEQQRVALVRALAPKPRLLLMDEPFSSLDKSLRRELRDETRRLVRQQGATTILVTHDTDDALAVSDRIVVLREGRVEQIGTPAEIYNQPANRYIASSFGPCNFIPRSAISGQDGMQSFSGIEPAQMFADECWIRPEGLKLASNQDRNVIASGTVTQSHFHGESSLIELDCKSPAGELFSLQVRQAGVSRLSPGDEAKIVLNDQ